MVWCFGAVAHWIIGGVNYLWLVFGVVVLIYETAVIIAFTIL